MAHAEFAETIYRPLSAISPMVPRQPHQRQGDRAPLAPRSSKMAFDPGRKLRRVFEVWDARPVFSSLHRGLRRCRCHLLSVTRSSN